MKYEKYKDSGVEWIGEVPSHWEVCRLKNYSNIVLGKMLMSTPPKGEEAKYTIEKYLKSRNIGWLQVYDNYDDVEEMWFNEYEKSIYRLQVNDIVMNEGGDIGKLGMWKNNDFPCYIQNSINKITAYRNISPFYLQYLLFAISKSNYFWSIVNPISIAHLTKDKLSNTPILVPPLSEQQAIASYLDVKCEKINTAIEVQKKKIELLEELKQSIITDAVTKGLNPNAPMKDSGVEWIGKVPSHWEVCRLKNYSNIVLGKMLMSTPPKGEEAKYTIEKYLKSRNIGWLQVYDNYDDVEEMWFNEYEKSIYRLQVNDIVMNEGGDIGKLGMWNNNDFPCYIQNSINKITAYRNISPFYLQYLLFAISKTNYFWSIVNPISIAHLTKDKLSNTPILVPPLSEQQTIIAHIEKEIAKIDNQISKANRRIELLEELKQSIITEAVTGKVKVC